MFSLALRCLPALAALLLVHTVPAQAQAKALAFDPGSRYICPNNSDTGLDCFLDAVKHLYTMCRHVKSIEVIEFGYQEAQQGVNGAKSEYCVNKQKINITRPYQAALREVTPNADSVNAVRTLYQTWLDAMTGLTWQTGESDEAYKERVSMPYATMTKLIDTVRVSNAAPLPAPRTATAAKAVPKAAAGKPPTEVKAKTN
jgi:hypothetical protein